MLIEALRVLVATVAACAQHVGEAHVGRVDVEEGHVLGALVGERVRDTGGRCEERSCAAREPGARRPGRAERQSSPLRT